MAFRVNIERAGFQVREDLIDAVERAWATLGSAGTWLNGEQRIGIAREVRQAAVCRFCAECKGALSPYAPEGEHSRTSDLPVKMVDVVHRCVTHPSRLSESWFNRVMASGIAEGEYAEIVGTVATVVAVDRFASGLGLPLMEFPEAQPGEPSREEPAGAKRSYAWIRTISTRDASGLLKQVWFGDGPPSFVPRVRQVLGLAPEMLRHFIPLSEAMYIPSRYIGVPNWGRAPLTRRQNELVATRSAALNDCFY